MQRNTIGLIWIGGAVLAIGLYLTGPDRFLAACFNVIDLFDAALHNLVFTLGAQVADVVRAAAIAVYIVFVVLAIMAAQRGHRAGWALIVVTAVMALLVWHRGSLTWIPVGRWLAALVLATVAALVMTRRLQGPLPPHPPWPPFRPPP